jgi:CrcB protein
MTKFLLLSSFGVGGVGLRYLIAMYSSRYFPSLFPFATLFINLVGSFLIGIVYVSGVEYAKINPVLCLGLMSGFLGGFTTFSAFSLETVRLLEKELWIPAFCYVVLSSLLGVGCAWSGIGITRWYLSR